MREKAYSVDVYDDPILHYSQPGERSLDLRKMGVTCVPRLGFSSHSRIRTGTGFHRHPGCLEICMCLRGNLYFESEGIQFPFFPGRVFVSRPDQPHRMLNSPKGLRVMDLLFSLPKKGRSVLNLPSGECAWLVDTLMHPPVRLFPATERIRTLFPRLFALHDDNGMSAAEKSLKLKSCMREFLIAVADAPKAIPDERHRPSVRLGQIVKRLYDHPFGHLHTEALAREAGLSGVAFFEEFKRATGLTPYAFMLDRRVRLAGEALRAGRKTADVARDFGFSSPQHFSAVFRNITGTTPGAARKGEQPEEVKP